jgi:hypothetical protein
LHRLAAARIDLGHLDPAAETLEQMLGQGASVDDVKSILERTLAVASPPRLRRPRQSRSERALCSPLTTRRADRLTI